MGDVVRAGSRFQPGQSGNPGGRPALSPEVRAARQLAKEHALEMVQILVTLARARKTAPKDKIAAAKTVLEMAERALDRAELSPEEKARALRELARQISPDE